MIIEPTIPCPICRSPIFIRQVCLPTGDIARVYAEPLTASDDVINFHKHQVGDVELSSLH